MAALTLHTNGCTFPIAATETKPKMSWADMEDDFADEDEGTGLRFDTRTQGWMATHARFRGLAWGNPSTNQDGAGTGSSTEATTDTPAVAAAEVGKPAVAMASDDVFGTCVDVVVAMSQSVEKIIEMLPQTLASGVLSFSGVSGVVRDVMQAVEVHSFKKYTEERFWKMVNESGSKTTPTPFENMEEAKELLNEGKLQVDRCFIIKDAGGPSFYKSFGAYSAADTKEFLTDFTSGSPTNMYRRKYKKHKRQFEFNWQTMTWERIKSAKEAGQEADEGILLFKGLKAAVAELVQKRSQVA